MELQRLYEQLLAQGSSDRAVSSEEVSRGTEAREHILPGMKDRKQGRVYEQRLGLSHQSSAKMARRKGSR
jgi:hypothetical protein